MGSCLCGGVRFEITGDLGPIACCHCSQCRKASGTAFATNANVARGGHRFVVGEHLVREYESTPGKTRAFCSRCGSPLYSRTATDPDTLRIRLGTLDGDPGSRPVLHVWTASKAPWFEVTDGLPQIPSLGDPDPS